MEFNTDMIIALLMLMHMWLVVRFCVLHTFRQKSNHRPYHLKWLMLVFFLPFIGYALYFWLTRNYVVEES